MGKAWMALAAKAQKKEFKPGETIVLVHTGGMAGRMAFNYRFGNLLPMNPPL